MLATGLCRGIADKPVMTDLGRVTVIGGSGFLGATWSASYLTADPGSASSIGWAGRCLLPRLALGVASHLGW
jgi:hypothetical protein